MAEGYRIIFWGILFITFHINLGPIPILPNFVGYIIVLRGIDHLQREFPSINFKRAHDTSMLLTILSVIGFLLIWAPQQSIIMSYSSLLFSVLEVLLVYYILEGSIEKLLALDSKTLADDYRREQRIYTVLMTIYVIGMCITITIAESSSIAVAILFIGICLRIWLMMILGRLKRIWQ